MVNHLFKVESSNVVVPEVNCDLICISFPLVIRNNNVLIQHAFSARAHNIHMQKNVYLTTMARMQVGLQYIRYIYHLI